VEIWWIEIKSQVRMSLSAVERVFQSLCVCGITGK